MSRRQQHRRGLTGSQILQQEVFGRRVTGGSGSVDVPADCWIPLSLGTEPAEIVTDGLGNFILVSVPL